MNELIILFLNDILEAFRSKHIYIYKIDTKINIQMNRNKYTNESKYLYICKERDMI
jgi:hypothetical protein